MFYRHPLFRLFFLTAFVMIFGWIGLKLVGAVDSQQAGPSTLHHPWAQLPVWLVARAAPDECDSAGLARLTTLDEKWLIWLDVQPDRQGELHVVCPDNKIFEIDAMAPLGPPLKAVLPALLKRGLIFNLRASDVRTGTTFIKVTDSLLDRKIDVGIASASQSVVRDLRKKRPQWLFAADSSTWTKLLAFSSLGLQSTVDLWPDFFVATQVQGRANSFTDVSAAEIHRRAKIEILEWDGESEVPSAWKQTLRGVLTNRPKIFPADSFFAKMGAK